MFFKKKKGNESVIEKARKEAKALHKRINKGEKANLWVCVPSSEISNEMDNGKCEICDGDIIYDGTLCNEMDKKAMKVCVICALKHYKDKIHPDQRKILMGNFQ